MCTCMVNAGKVGRLSLIVLCLMDLQCFNLRDAISLNDKIDLVDAI